jgi:DMSO reductase anchor subunit
MNKLNWQFIFTLILYYTTYIIIELKSHMYATDLQKFHYPAKNKSLNLWQFLPHMCDSVYSNHIIKHHLYFVLTGLYILSLIVLQAFCPYRTENQ